MAEVQTLYSMLGGATVVRDLVDRFYDYMDTDPSVRGIRDLHPAELKDSRDKLYMFLSGWLGGPQLFTEKFGHPRLRARHLPFTIGESERDQWMFCMRKALQHDSIPENLRMSLDRNFLQLATHMINADMQG